jgi:hypothetical protein
MFGSASSTSRYLPVCDCARSPHGVAGQSKKKPLVRDKMPAPSGVDSVI